MKLVQIIFQAIILTGILHLDAYAQQKNTSKQTLFSMSESLAFEMGKTYQLAKNCRQELANIAEPQVTILFGNYLEKHEVIEIMKQYRSSITQKKTKSCEYDAIQTNALMQKISNYIRFAAPFSGKRR